MDSTSKNSFLINGGSKKQPFSWYLLGSFVIILFSFIGQIPMFFFLPDNMGNVSDPMEIFNSLDSNLTLVLFLVPYLVAFLGFILVVYRLHEQNLKNVTTSRSKIDWSRVVTGFVYWGIISLLLFVVDWFLFPDHFVWNFDLTSFLLLFCISSLLIPFQSALEEWLFRGYLMQGFAQIIRYRWFPLIMTSLVFGTLHIFNPEIDKLGYGLLFYYIGTGLFFGVISLMDDGIELAIGLHVANNLITALLVTADWTAFQSASIFKDISNPDLISELFVSLLVLYPLTLWFFACKYGWKDWKNKLLGPIN